MVLALLIILIYFHVLFTVATIIKNNSIVDIGWGFGYVLTSAVLYFTIAEQSVEQLIILILISLWGLRLFYHILKRNLFEEEDFRYKNWRKQWGKWVVPRAFLQVFMLQGLLMFIIGSTVFYLFTISLHFNVFTYIGMFVFLSGLSIESLGDFQLKKYLQDPNKAPLLQTGLWSLTRHPNYTGEGLLWIGFYLISLSLGAPVYFIISPLTINAVLYFISIPILEEKMAQKPGWDEYASTVASYIPWVK